MVFKSKKGSEFVEASVVMPVVILAVLAVLWMIINLYTAASAQAGGHMLLREYAGADSGTHTSAINISNAAPHDRFGSVGFTSSQTAANSQLHIEKTENSGFLRGILKAGIYGEASYDFNKVYTIGTSIDAASNHSSSVYLINQSAGIRRLDLLRQKK